MHRPELQRPRGRDRSGGPGEPILFTKSPNTADRPVRRRTDPARLDETRLGGRAGHRDRPADQLSRQGRGGPRRHRRIHRGQRRQRTGLPDRTRRAVVQGQVGRDVQSGRTVAGDAGRDRRRARPGHVARRQRRTPAERVHLDDDLRSLFHRALSEPVPGARTRRPDQHRNTPRRRDGSQAPRLAPARRRDGTRHRRVWAANARRSSGPADGDSQGDPDPGTPLLPRSRRPRPPPADSRTVASHVRRAVPSLLSLYPGSYLGTVLVSHVYVGNRSPRQPRQASPVGDQTGQESRSGGRDQSLA